MNHFLDTGRIFLFGDIKEQMAFKIIKQIRYLVDQKRQDIFLYVASGGGCYDAATAIIDEMLGAQSIGIAVHTICLAYAYSAASDILTLGSPSCRFATKNSTIMMHPLSFELGEDYSVNQKTASDHLEQKAQHMNLIIAKACGHNTKSKLKTFLEKTSKGLWLNATQATKFGVVDGIWDYKKERDIGVLSSVS